MPRTRHRPSGFSPTAVENLRRNRSPRGIQPKPERSSGTAAQRVCRLSYIDGSTKRIYSTVTICGISQNIIPKLITEWKYARYIVFKAIIALLGEERKNNVETDQEEKNELAGSLTEKKLPTEGCTGRNGERRRFRGRRRYQIMEGIKYGSYAETKRTHFDIGRHARIPTRNTILRWVASFRITGSTLKKKSPGRNSIALRLSEATVRSRALRLLSLGPFEGAKVDNVRRTSSRGGKPAKITAVDELVLDYWKKNSACVASLGQKNQMALENNQHPDL
ncbi:hypothetical protein ANN_20137 [Periplaneta americana]|uniref:Uncharacterized protein n=1 Tax=Periplaneta americana TaxID=6978 RepID=A0ABQ8SC20_PERAM|nr:hypothetical protein ANN_20137 [Periplaneta americana]